MRIINQRSKIYAGMYVLALSILMSCTQQKTVEFFVSPTGNDANPGTEAAPFQTLEKAKESVRARLSETPGKQVVVTIKGGVYNLEKPVVFSAGDSGTEEFPVVYKAAEGEKPVFTGSRELKSWQLLSNAEKLKILPPEARGKIYVTDVKAAGISDFGDPTETGKRPELFSNGQMQTLARWPNKGFVHAGLAKGKTEHAPTYIEKHGTVEGVFEYLGNRQDRWAAENDARLGGYWYWDWSDEYQKVKKTDTRTKTIYLCEPYHYYGYRDSLRYFGLNLFCEIDQPCEWYLDRTDGLLYWFPPEGVNPDQSNVTFSVFSAPFMVEMKDCSNVVLEGLTFQEGRGSAIYIGEGKNCLLSGCRIERFGKDGIHIDGGEGHGISGCLLQYFGCSGIDIKGGDRKTLTPANHFIENTVVGYFSLYKRTYEPAVYAEGCGIRINNNRFGYSSSSAMRLEGNDFTIEYNEVSHVVNESDDQGGIDIYYNPSYRGLVIRYNRWSDIRGGTNCGAAGVRLDDMISGVTIFGNIFERCGALHFGGVQIHGGKDNIVENNLFYNCSAAVSFSKWKEDRWLEELEKPVMKKKLYEEVDINSALYQSRYPELKNIRTGINVNTIKNNLLVDCDKIFIGGEENEITENNSSVSSEGKTVENFCSPELLKNYGMQPIPVGKIGPKNNKWINEKNITTGIQAQEYNILRFGAKPDGQTISTKAIQSAIDQLSEAGGGKLIIPAGKFLTGSLQMKSDVHLYLEKGAVLLGSPNPYHYSELKMPGRPETEKKDDNSQMALLVAYKADNITISGEGKIDGQGRALALNIDSLHHIGERVDPHYNIHDMRPNETMRPKLFRFSTCTNVRISGLELQNSACWGLSFELCHNLKIDGVKVLNRAYWNNDGMDISDCRNVSITNCDVNSADDGICLKSYYPGYADDSIYIANCTIRTSASAVKFGTASYGGFKNVTIKNLKIYDTFRSAIAIESVDGAGIENIEVSDIVAKNTGNAIFIRLGHRGGKTPGSIKNVYIHDMKVQVAFGRPDIDYDMRGPAVNFFHNPFPSSITGIPEDEVENIRIENVEITYPGRASKGMAYVPQSRLSQVPEQINDYPEFHMFRELPSWGFYVRHAKDITFKNVTVATQKPDFRPACVFDDVQGVKMDNVNMNQGEEKTQIVLRNVTAEKINVKPELIKTVN